jgi:hypothetical protein
LGFHTTVNSPNQSRDKIVDRHAHVVLAQIERGEAIVQGRQNDAMPLPRSSVNVRMAGRFRALTWAHEPR